MSAPILSVRVNDQERALLEAAAKQSRTTVSDFVRRKALDAAEIDVLAQTRIVIPAADWAKFEAWASEPPRRVPELERLARSPPAWTD